MKHPLLSFTMLATLMIPVFSACSKVEPQLSHAATQQQANYLDTLFTEYFEANLHLNPLQATFLGDHRFNDQLENSLSEEHRTRQRMLEEEYLALLDEVEPELLTEQDQLSFKIFKRNREITLESLQYPEHLLPVNQFYNFTSRLAMLGSGKSAQPFNSISDYDDWYKRLQQVPVLIEQAITNMQQGLEQGVVQPAILMEKALPQISAHLVNDIEDSMFYAPISNFPATFGDSEKARLESMYQDVLMDHVLPAYQRLHAFIENEYLPHARTESYGLGALPEGRAWYDFKIRWRTTTDLSADEIHQIGVEEVTRIHSEIEKIMATVGFSGTLTEFFDFTQTDEQFIYSSRQAMLDDYRAFAAQVDAVTETLFHRDMFPQASYEIRKVEKFREQSASSGSYQSPSEDGARPGIFYLNTYDLSARPTWAKGALVLHEAAPGHHYQIALQRDMQNLPDFRRFGGETAFIEGWGLYAESLGDELGVYEPYDRFGALVAELWRSIRLVVDTGIHAQGWSRAEVLDYMRANAPVSDARAIAEAERFMALPGQALAYKIGQLEIRQLRSEAEQALGEDFNVRDFHREVLRHGSLPLSLLREQLHSWLALELERA